MECDSAARGVGDIGANRGRNDSASRGPRSSGPSGPFEEIYRRVAKELADEARSYTGISEDTEFDFDFDTSFVIKTIIEKESVSYLSIFLSDSSVHLQLHFQNGSRSQTVEMPRDESDLLLCVDLHKVPSSIIDLLSFSPQNLFYCGLILVKLLCEDSCIYTYLECDQETYLDDITTALSESHPVSTASVNRCEMMLLRKLFPDANLQLDKSLYSRKRNVSVVDFTASKRMRREMIECPDETDQPAKFISPYFSGFPITSRDSETSCSNGLNFSVLPKPVAPPGSRENILRNKEERLKSEYESSRLINRLADDSLVVDMYHNIESQTSNQVALITILRRPFDNFYFGELVISPRGASFNNRSRGACRFELGSKARVDRYIEEYKRMVSDKDRGARHYTSTGPRFPTVVSSTQGPRPRPLPVYRPQFAPPSGQVGGHTNYPVTMRSPVPPYAPGERIAAADAITIRGQPCPIPCTSLSGTDA